MLRITLKHFFLAVFFSFFLCPQIIFAADPPNLISPPDGSTEGKSPKLTWQYSGGCVESGSCFRIEVDNSDDFSSPEKTTYTNSFSYTPQGLAEGSWNWRVKAKDQTEKWSEWSKVFKFTISSQSSTPSPTSQTTPIPQTTPTSTPFQKPSNLFEIKDLPSEINSNQETEVSVFLDLSDKSNTRFYLKGAFKKEGSSNYFGQTFASSWVKNNSSYSNQFKIETDKDGRWEGKIKVKPDPDDSGFDGTGSYLFKISRYTDSGSGPTWSNELTLKINAVEVIELSSSTKPTASGKEAVPDKPEEIDLTASLVSSPEKNYEIKIASVAGEATESHNTTLEKETKVLEEKKVNWLLVILGIGVLLSGVGFTYFKFKNGKINAIN